MSNSTPKGIVCLLFACFFAVGKVYGQKSTAIHPGAGAETNFTSFPETEKVPDDVWSRVNPRVGLYPDAVYLPMPGGKKYVEVAGKRKTDEKYYVDPEQPGHFVLEKGYTALNYQKDGRWLTVDAHLKPAGNDIYEASAQWEPVGVDAAHHNTYIRTAHGLFSFNQWSLYGSNGTKEELLATADWSHYTVGEDGIRITNIFPGVDAEMRTLRGGIKTNLVVRKLQFTKYEKLLFRDHMEGLGGLHFADREIKESTGIVYGTMGREDAAVKINQAIIYDKENPGSATVFPYRVNGNDLDIVITNAYLKEHVGNGGVVIDPQVTSTNSISQSLVGTPFNASCTWITSCDYTINVVPPAAAVITDVQDQVEVLATAPCGRENFGYQIVSGSCISPGAGVVWIANGTTGPGTMWAGYYSEPALVACMPAASCTPSGVDFTFHLFRTCVGPTTPACDNTCLGLNNPLSVRLVGYTVQYSGITAYPADTTCYGNTLGIKAVPQYGVTPYATTNWSFSSTGSPSIGTGDSISLGVLTPGTYTVYASTTDACGNTAQTSKVVKVYPIPAVSSVSRTNPTTCSSSDGSVTLYGLSAGTTYIVNYTKNGTAAGPVTVSSDASGALTIAGLTAGTYTSFQLTAHGCASGVSGLSTTITNPTAAAVSVTGNPCTANVITMTANPSWGINTWQYNGSPVITDTLVTWSTNGTVVAGGNGAGSALNQLNTGPLGVSTDIYGNVYVADNNNHRIVKWQPGATAGIVVAGGNGAGSGLNQLNAAYGVYADADSNVYIADRNNNRIVKWAPGATSGVIVAGGNGAGSALNQINAPRGVFVDAAKNVYVADMPNNRIVKWAPGATTGVLAAGGNGAGSATNQLNSPTNVFVDASGTMFIADFSNNRIVKWLAGAASGTTVAGGNGSGSAANQFNGPRGIKVDGNGFLYVADQNNNRIQKWAQGAASGKTVAGGNGAGTALNQVNNPVDVAMTPDGAIYALEQNNQRVTKFTPKTTDTLVPGASGTYTANVTAFNGCTSTGSINWVQKDTVLITANPGSIICAGSSITFSATALHGGTSPVYTWKRNGTVVGTNSATFTTSALTDKDVISCTFSSSNPCTVSDSLVITVNPLPTVTLTGNPCTANMIVMNSSPVWSINAWQNNGTPVVTDTNTWNQFATVAAGGNGAGSAANQINFPLGVFADAAGNVYVADAQNHRIQKWAPGATSGVTVAGGNGAGSAANQLSYPFAVAVDADTNVYVMEWGNARVSKWAYGATSGVTVAGGNGGGSALNQLNAAQGLFVDADKNVYVSDNSNARVVKWAPGAASGIVVAGGNGTGSGLNQFNNPVSVYVDGAKNLYVSDYNNHRVMKWAPGATSGTIVAGGNGAGAAANQLNGPRVSWLDGSGNIYVCDQNNARVQRWRPGATSGTTVVGGNGAGNALNQLNSPTGIYVSDNGDIYTVEQNNNRALKFSPKPADTLAPTTTGTYTATVTAFNGCTNTASINWIQADTISISANPGYEICAGTSVTFTAAILHPGTSPVYTWKKNGATVGTNSATYTATGLNNNDRISCTFTSSSCTVSDSVVMIVNPMPVPAISGTPCSGKTLTINPGLTSLQTQWLYNGSAFQTYDAAWQQNGTVVAGGNGAGNALNQLNLPSSVFADAAGNVIVTDISNQRIMKWAPGATSGTIIAGGNGSGSGLNQFIWSNGVIPGYNSNEIFVSDANNYRVVKWLQGGTAGTLAAGSNGSGSGLNQVRPYNAALDGYGNLFLPDDQGGTAQRVLKWKLGYGSGTLAAAGNGQGSAANQLNSPISLVIDNNATVLYISDANNHRVQKWTVGGTTGTTVAGGNGAGAGLNQLNSPYGIQIDGLKNIYISDAGNNRIQRWAAGAATGTTIVGGNGAGAGLNQINSPDGIFLDGNGNLYIPENYNNRVTRFQAYNTDSLVAANAGTYKVIITSFKGCRDSATYVVNQTPVITSKTSVNPTTCAGANGSITLNGLTANTTFSVSYKKNGVTVGPVNMTSNGSGSIVISSLSSGAYNNFSITATGGCLSPSDTATINLVDPNPPAAPVASSNTPVCEGQTLNLSTPAVAGVTYSWTGPNSFSSNSQNPSIATVTAAAAGTYSLTTTNTTTGCTSAAGTTTVVIKPLPVVPTAGSNSPVCTGQTINLTASTATSGATYSWTGPNSFATTTQNPSVTSATTAAAGTYSVVSVLNGCQSTTTATVSVSVNVTPVISSSSSASPSTCNGTNGTITLNGLNATTTYTINYSKNGTPAGPVTLTSSLSGAITIPNLSSGTYTSITAGAGTGCTSAPVGPFTLTDPPIPATPVAGSNTPVCEGQPLNLTASAASGVSYSWTGPNSFTSSAQNPVINPVTAAAGGTYSVTITNTTTNCTSAAATTTVVIKPLPAVPAAGSNSPVCVGQAISLTASSTTGGATYSWSGPNSFSSTTQNPTISNATAAATGSYFVYAYLNGCQSAASGSVNVTVKPLPNAPTVSSNSPVCSGAGNTLNLTASSTTPSVTYSWTGPNAFSSSSQNPSVTSPTTAASGTYTATVTLSGCTSAASTNVVINQTPAAPAVTNISYCQFETPTQLTATGTNLKWYTAASGGTPLGAAPTPGTLVATTLTWYVSQSDGVTGCESQRAAISVTIKPKPVTPTGTASYTYCQFEPASALTATGVNQLWYTSATGGTGGNIAPVPSTAVAGVYNWWVSQTVNGCESDRFMISVTVKPKPAPPIVNTPVVYCQYDAAVPLTAIGSNLKWYTSSTGGNGASLAPTPYTGVQDTLTWWVTQTINGCESDRSKLDVYIYYKPNGIVVASKPYVCQYDTITFWYFGNALPDAQYDWKVPFQAGTIISGSGQGPITVRFDSAGDYNVRMQVNNHGCVSNEAFQLVHVRPVPVVRLSLKDDACQDEVVTLSLGYSSMAVDQYAWSFGGGTVLYGSFDGGPFGVQWNTPGRHVVSLTATSNGCKAKPYTDTINIHELPDARILSSAEQELCTGDSILLKGTVADSGYTYLWSPQSYFGEYATAGPEAWAVITHTGYVRYELSSTWGCKASDSLLINTKPCCEVYFPNAFTPNKDGHNDLFRVITQGHHHISNFRVMNRWGQTVFETADERRGWDGTFGGADQPMGTYYYYIKYECEVGKYMEQKGEVILLR